MGEIADDHVDRMMAEGPWDRYGDDWYDRGTWGAPYRRAPIDRTSNPEDFPIVEEPVKENIIEGYLRAKVKANGGEHRKVVYQGRKGSPDDWCFFPGGLLIIVECKRPGEKPTKQQAEEIAWLISKGFNATWVSTKEEIDQLFDRHFPEWL